MIQTVVMKQRKALLLSVVLSLFLALMVGTSAAQTSTLSLNSGNANVRWYVTGEASLVLNGFDLDTFKVTRPTQVHSISISVLKATPGVPVQAVVYQDANGGSPSDAKLLVQKSVDIQSAGTYTVTFDAPVNVTERFLWVGFYMPVGFEFNGDSSGTSVLTYWGWTPNGTFDLNNLASAAVLGAANGAAPVNINMQGKARITAQISGSATTPDAQSTLVPGLTPTPVRQLQGDAGTSLNPLSVYHDCGTLYYDRDDINVTYSSNVTFHCKVVETRLRPDAPEGYRRQGPLYDVYVFGIPSGTVTFPHAVTHCIKPAAHELSTAVIGLGHGAPREWEVLPSVRYGDYVCAEIWHSGFISYLVPR